MYIFLKQAMIYLSCDNNSVCGKCICRVSQDGGQPLEEVVNKSISINISSHFMNIGLNSRIPLTTISMRDKIIKNSDIYEIYMFRRKVVDFWIVGDADALLTAANRTQVRVADMGHSRELSIFLVSRDLGKITRDIRDFFIIIINLDMKFNFLSAPLLLKIGFQKCLIKIKLW